MRWTLLAELDANVMAALRRDGTIDLTTIGARSGKPRRIEIWYLHLEDRTFITGTSGLRGWYANILANPSVVFHLKESVRADLVATACPVLDPALREWVFTRRHPWSRWYLSAEPLESLVETAPMVEITFD
jgi:deazaflavin-dependent oxidoreductase (nitroreductase family)